MEKQNKENEILVSFEGEVFDLSEFAESHPGGAELIEACAGRDISAAFDELHQHSKYARQLLREHKSTVTVGELQSHAKISAAPKDTATPGREDFFIDLNKPLLAQIWHSGWDKKYYLEQVHIPRYTAHTPPFFESRLLNALTINYWWGVPMFWVPVILACNSYAAQRLSAFDQLGTFLVGIVLWTVYEYVFHRFVFHIDRLLPNHRAAIMLHFCLHGVHHFLPMDRHRLVMPPLLLLSMTVPVTLAIHTVFAWPTTLSLVSGSLTGYIAYDLLHYYFHHGRSVGGYLQLMKSYHTRHHYSDPNLGFGVSSMLWDAVFGTLLPPAADHKTAKND